MTARQSPSFDDRDDTLGSAWQEPTVYDAFVDGATGRIPGTDVVRLRGLILCLGFLVLLAAIIPSLRAVDRVLPPGISVVVIAVVQVVRARRLQDRFGRSRSHAAWAAFGVISIGALVILTFILASLVLGQPVGNSPLERLFEALDPSTAMAAVAVLFVGTIIGSFVLALTIGRRRGARHEAGIEAAIRVERSARARVTGLETT